jgi:hypothetical protein
MELCASVILKRCRMALCVAGTQCYIVFNVRVYKHTSSALRSRRIARRNTVEACYTAAPAIARSHKAAIVAANTHAQIIESPCPP